MTGDLTCRGVTKSVTFDAMRTGEAETPQGYKAGFEATFTIKRSDFGVKYGLPNALADEVTLYIALEGAKG